MMKKATVKIEIKVDCEYDNTVWSENDARDAIRFLADANLQIQHQYVKIIGYTMK